MLTLIIKWVLYAGAVFLVGNFLPGIHVPDFVTALVVALVIGVMNVTIRPILKVLTFPINILTLGLFGLLLNTFLFWSVSYFVKDFHIDGFWWAAIGVFLVSIVSAIGNRLVLGSDGEFGNSSSND